MLAGQWFDNGHLRLLMSFTSNNYKINPAGITNEGPPQNDHQNIHITCQHASEPNIYERSIWSFLRTLSPNKYFLPQTWKDNHAVFRRSISALAVTVWYFLLWNTWKGRSMWRHKILAVTKGENNNICWVNLIWKGSLSKSDWFPIEGK